MSEMQSRAGQYTYRATETPWWAYALLGAVLVLTGLFMLGNVYFATFITVMLIAIPLLIGGAAEVIHAFAAPGWRGFFLSLTIGIFFLIAGGALLANPVGGAVVITLILSISLIASGIARIALAMNFWRSFGWLLLASGLAAILFGVVILAYWPQASLSVLGLLFGLDLLFLGIWWIAYATNVRSERRARATGYPRAA